jgi:hypothetical protein
MTAVTHASVVSEVQSTAHTPSASTHECRSTPQECCHSPYVVLVLGSKALPAVTGCLTCRCSSMAQQDMSPWMWVCASPEWTHADRNACRDAAGLQQLGETGIAEVHQVLVLTKRHAGPQQIMARQGANAVQCGGTGIAEDPHLFIAV